MVGVTGFEPATPTSRTYRPQKCTNAQECTNTIGNIRFQAGAFLGAFVIGARRKILINNSLASDFCACPGHFFTTSTPSSHYRRDPVSHRKARKTSRKMAIFLSMDLRRDLDR